MKIVKSKWTIEELIEKENSIDPKPQYQRTPVWNDDRKAYLMDSILRGYDIPKIYLKYLEDSAKNGHFEVVDGQQRMRAIWGFVKDEFQLGKNVKINGVDLSKMLYSDLPLPTREEFLEYEINVSEILQSNVGEVNDLFTRLQKGVSLNPTEIRHALISNIGSHINDFVEKQKVGFFDQDCKIEDKRFKHQDYIDHSLALIHYKNTKDLKAATLYQLYIDFLDRPISEFNEYFREATIVLNFMKRVNSNAKGVFKNKWGFIDGFWMIHRNRTKLREVNPKILAERLVEFELERKKFNDKPENLLDPRFNSKFGKSMFDYIQAFNKEGANRKNIEVRAKVYDNVFKSIFKFDGN